jgi:hypothetical protein
MSYDIDPVARHAELAVSNSVRNQRVRCPTWEAESVRSIVNADSRLEFGVIYK